MIRRAARLAAALLGACLATAAAIAPSAADDTPVGLSAADYIARADVLQKRGDTAGAIASLERAAQVGGSTPIGGRALYLLGVADIEGRAPGANAARGYQRLEQAAARGSSAAARRLFEAQSTRRYAPSDPAGAARTYERLAKSGSTSAALALGDLHASGALGTADLAAAEQWYGRAAALTNNGKRRLALVRAAQGDEAGAIAALEGLTTRSLSSVYRDIANDLSRGTGVPRNAAMAARFAARADALEPPKHKTPGPKKIPGPADIPLAALTATQVEALRAAARNGDAAAAARLADAIEAGIATGAPIEIVSLRATALAKGRTDVSDGLVRALGTAPFEAREASLAVETLLRAANGGSADAMAALGRLYAAGGPVAADLANSTRWYERAAEKGNTEAQFRTGLAYVGGLGVVADDAEARRWLGQAAGGGHPLARVTLAQLTNPPAAAPVAGTTGTP